MDDEKEETTGTSDQPDPRLVSESTAGEDKSDAPDPRLVSDIALGLDFEARNMKRSTNEEREDD